MDVYAIVVVVGLSRFPSVCVWSSGGGACGDDGNGSYGGAGGFV